MEAILREIRQFETADFEAAVDLIANAYPISKVDSEEAWQTLLTRMQGRHTPETPYYGLWENGRLLGVMILYNFTMKLLSTKTLVGGVGGIAVDLAHKKEKVARDMILYYLRHYRAAGACLAALYPFRPDFYRQMGWGFGSKMSQYRVAPAALPRGNKQGVSFLQAGEETAVLACYHRYLEQTNGLMLRTEAQVAAQLGQRATRFVGYRNPAGELRGYLAFQFEPGAEGHFISHNIVVHELIYETPQALASLLTFLHTQADQIERIVFHVQDDNFHHLFDDPRNGSGNLHPPVYHESNTQGVGIMYRVIDVARLFTVLRDHNFGGQTCRLKLTVRDDFLPENEAELVLEVINGRCRPTNGPYDVAIELNIADFSSMITGALSFQQLHQYGRVHISNPDYTNTINNLFAVAQKPLCLTRF